MLAPVAGYFHFNLKQLVQDDDDSSESADYDEEDFEDYTNYYDNYVAFYIHIFCGVIAIWIGPFQFLPSFRHQYLKIHKICGKIYGLTCIVGSITGGILAINSQGGMAGHIGFMGMAIAWFITTVGALYYIKLIEIVSCGKQSKNIIKHREWMIRSFAMTFSAPSFRFFLIFGIPFSVLTFVWIFNGIVAEIYIYKHRQWEKEDGNYKQQQKQLAHTSMHGQQEQEMQKTAKAERARSVSDDHANGHQAV